MNFTRGIGLTAIVMMVGGATWLGCGGDDSTGGTPTDDAGTTTDTGTGGGDDTGTGNPDTGTGTDSGGGTDAARDTGTDSGPVVDLNCDTYCNALATACTGDTTVSGPYVGTTAGEKQFNSLAACKGACAAYTKGTAQDTSGDTLGCREYHTFNVTASGKPVVHCPHSGISGGGVCTAAADGGATAGRCATFCALQNKICTGANAAYASEAACLASCGTDYVFVDTTAQAELTTGGGNTLNCRQYHLTAAADPAGTATHCGHIGKTSATCKAN